jgi:AcrR family transcriptional regulator
MPIDREALPAAQHARLLEGLAASIRQKGLAATQVTDIVRHARASRRTFYKHFADKESCFVELTEVLSRMVMAQVEQAIERDAPLATQIDQAVDTYVDLLLSDRGLTATFASPSLGDRIVIAQREGVERYAELLVSVVRANAERDPDIAPVSLQRAYMLIAGCQEAIVRAVSRGEDLAATASEIKAVMKLALVGRATAVPEPEPAR